MNPLRKERDKQDKLMSTQASRSSDSDMAVRPYLIQSSGPWCPASIPPSNFNY